MLENETKDIIQDILGTIRQYPKNNALVIEDVHYTYAQLGRKIGGIQSILSKNKDERIGIVADSSIETYASILATLASGKTYVILHPSYPESRNLRIAELAGLQTILYTGDFKHDAFSEKDIKMIDAATLGEQNILELQYNITNADTNAYIMFTSGSTGDPKGVPITRANLNAFYRAYNDLGWALDEHDRMLQMFELTFDLSVVSLLHPLTLGACIYPVGYRDVKHLKVFDLLETYELTFAAITPSLLQLLSPYFGDINLPALKYLILAAEASPVELLEQFRDSVPNAEFVNLYGPTEATIYCTCYRIPKNGSKHHNGMVAIGKPFKGVDALIADEDGKVLPWGEMGELLVSGSQIMAGYLDDPTKTAEALVQADNGKIYYRTGDLCILDRDGDIIYCGRKDYQVKIQGFRIELSEIEYTAKQFFDNLCNVVVIPATQEGINTELHMVVEAAECEDKKLQEYLKEKLPRYMIPNQIHCIPQFPVSTSNKVDRKKIAQLI
jgi:D-alanine--poly(phosphoribitol) ligase subunit 1